MRKTGGYSCMPLDDIDQKIIGILKNNGRAPHNEIAAKVGVSEGTVRNRISKLMERDILKIQGLVNPAFITEKTYIFLGIKIAINKDTIEMADAIVELPDVHSVTIVTGRFDLLVEVFIEPHNLIDFLSQDLAQTGTVVSVESFITLKSFNKWI